MTKKNGDGVMAAGVSASNLNLEELRKLVAEEKARRVREAVEKRLSSKARLVAVELGRRVFKTHGNYYIYPPEAVVEKRFYYTWDERRADLVIVYDDYGYNIDVFWHGQKVLDVHMGDITLYIPGEWEQVLEELYEKARELAEERKREEELRKLIEEARKWNIDIDIR